MKIAKEPSGLMHKSDPDWQKKHADNIRKRIRRLQREALKPYIDTGLFEVHGDHYRLKKMFLRGTPFYIRAYVRGQSVKLTWYDFRVYHCAKAVSFPEVFEQSPSEIRKKLAFHLDVFGPVDIKKDK